ncbi:hypothetical protein [Arthrobacter sp. JUb115]|uniref:hypothetical protein n=1 Tax=Arthrobacter sp. JUb115 TaxID=2485108 RepID=UPI00105B44F4|nr:hypothetical protein [Arthrobacter sp. JUb115]TDU19182.1 hypothetical protein EDF61_11523 [Arthrobacter sp. JUb115]
MGNRGIEPRTLALGRSRFGGGKALMITLVLGSGLLAAVVLSTLISLLVDFDEGFWPAWINLAFTFWLVASAIAWFFFVDRSSLPKLAKNPEQTVEQNWHTRAQAGVYRDLITILGLGCVTVSLVSLIAGQMPAWPVPLVFAGLILAALLDYMIRYQLVKRAES